MLRIARSHEIDAGHRVLGHEGKCANLHGHRYCIEFICEAPGLDSLGRIIDFAVLKTRLCAWLDEHWDHRLLLYERDPLCDLALPGAVPVPFNPTAENIAAYLVEHVGPLQLHDTDVRLAACLVHETAKCSASYER